MKIEDNFLEQKEFDELQNLIMGQEFFWYYNDSVAGFPTEKDTFQFVHQFYGDCAPNSPYFKALNPILVKIDLQAIWRIKVNLLTRTPNIIETAFHVDIGFFENSPEKLKQWTTSIFYMNSNNGYTKLEDGTKIESVANRMVTFSADTKHCGTTCTDEKTRAVINFDYWK